MGNFQSSRNHIKSLNEITTRVIQQSSQTCQVDSSQIQSIVAAGNCQNLVVKNVDFSQLVGVDFTCLQQADLNAKILNDLKEQFDQMAKSFVSGIQFNLASIQDTRNFIDLHNQLATEIVNQVTQSCIVNAGQYQGIVCTGGSVLVQNATFKQIMESIFDCSQKGSTVADVTNHIEEFIKQVAISENKGLSFDVLFILMIVFVIGGIVLIMNKALDWKFLAIGLPILCIIIFIIYLLIANKKNWWPFKSKFDDKKRKPEPPVKLEPGAIEIMMQRLEQERALGKLRLGIFKPRLTPEEYRQLKYGDDQVAFQRPFSSKACL